MGLGGRNGRKGGNFHGRSRPHSAADSSTAARGDWLPSEGAFECGYSHNVGYIIDCKQEVRGEFSFIALLGYVDHNDHDQVRD